MLTLFQHAYKYMDYVPKKKEIMVSNTTFSNSSVISWWSVVLVEETGVTGENHRYVASN